VDYAAQHPNRTLMILQAGCTTVGQELDLDELRASTHGLVISLVDDDSQVARAALASRPELRSATLGELRTVPMGPRSFDIVQCSMLLHRIGNAELVLGRLVAALRPGGLLLLRTADRDTAAAFLDRRLPQFVRTVIWRATRPGEPGPFPARYEQIASARGIEAFVTRHGLAVAHRQACSAIGGHGRRANVPAQRRLVAWLSRGHLAAGHDELRYVIRKPEDRFARILP
jgi:SAM-dependent methyltransferase